MTTIPISHKPMNAVAAMHMLQMEGMNASIILDSRGILPFRRALVCSFLAHNPDHWYNPAVQLNADGVTCSALHVGVIAEKVRLLKGRANDNEQRKNRRKRV